MYSREDGNEKCFKQQCVSVRSLSCGNGFLMELNELPFLHSSQKFTNFAVTVLLFLWFSLSVPHNHSSSTHLNTHTRMQGWMEHITVDQHIQYFLSTQHELS